MNWPISVAFLGFFAMIASIAIVDEITNEPFTIRFEADERIGRMLDLAEQQTFIINETVVDGCSLNVTSCATTVMMFAGHSMSPQAYFSGGNVRVFDDRVVVINFTDRLYLTRAVGESMKPFMGNVTLLYRKPRNLADVKIGDLLIYNASIPEKEHFIVHQVVRKEDGKLFTKGYNNPAIDARNITIRDAVGIVVGVLY